MYRIKWKAEVSPYSLKIINHWIREVEYPLAQISKVVVDNQNMVVFVGKKKVVRIPIISDHYDALEQVALSAKVPYYKSGQDTPFAGIGSVVSNNITLHNK